MKHPGDDELRRFLSGQFETDADNDRIEQHLEACDECSSRLEELDESDAFVEDLRTAHGRNKNVLGSMMNPDSDGLTADEFLNNLHDSKLLTSAQIKAAQQFGIEDLKQLVTAMVSQGWITSWQADQLLAGQKSFYLGKYKLLDMLGAGGMGAVFKAQESTGLEREVAIKVMAQQLKDKESSVRRFRREMEAVAALNHPNIVAAYDADCISDNTYFLVMEYVPGQDLNSWRKSNGRLPIGWSCECIRQAAVGLEHAHHNGLIHRDIKPSNLLVIGDDTGTAPQIKILDLGLARFTEHKHEESKITATGEIMGTVEYIAPEQALNNKSADHRADIFSLGCTLFELITGDVPFPGDTTMEKLCALASHEPLRLSSKMADIPPELDNIVAKMLARGPIDRYQSAAEVVAALEPFCVVGPEDRVATKRMDAASASSGRTMENATTDIRIGDAIQSDSVPQIDMQAANRSISEGNGSARNTNLLVWAVGGLATLAAVIGVGSYLVWNSQRPEGTLAITVDQPECEIVVDDTITMTSPVTRELVQIPLTEGEHRLEVRKQGFPPYSESFVIRGGQVNTRTIKLAHAAQPPTPPVIEQPAASPNPNDARSTQRDLAQWVLSQGGTLRIQSTAVGDSIEVQAPGPLPDEDFDIIGLWLKDVALQSADLALLTRATSLDELSLTAAGLNDAAAVHLKSLHQLRKLDLSHNYLTDAGLVHIGEIPKLKELNLTKNPIQGTGLVHLKDLPLLTLFLDETPASDVAMTHVQQFRTLQTLSINNTQVTDRGLEHLSAVSRLNFLQMKKIPVSVDAAQTLLQLRIRILHLSGNQIDDAFVARLSAHPTLETLFFSRNTLTDSGLQALAGMTNLKDLALFGNPRPTSKGFSQLARLPQLSVLNLSGCRNVDDACLESWMELNPTNLVLYNTQVTQQGVARYKSAHPNCLLQWSPADPHRGVAEFYRKVGAKLTILLDVSAESIPLPESTPSGPFVIKSIDFTGTRITDPDLAVLDGLDSIEDVNLNGTQITDDGLVHVAKLPALSALYLNETQITDDGLAHLAGLTKLGHLDLNEVRIIGSGLAHLSNLTELNYLGLDGTQVTDENLIHLSKLPRLEFLGLRRTAVTDAGVETLVSFPRLAHLRLADTRTTSQCAEHLLKMPKLRQLFVNRQTASDEFVARLKQHPSMDFLWLGQSPVTDQGVEHIVQMQSLKTLGFTYNTQVTDEGFAQLQRLKNLRVLHLAGENVTDATLQRLRTMTHLRELRLTEIKATSQNVAKLQRELPNCRIHHSR